jgi:hypothetical protein
MSAKRIWKITGEAAKKAACREILAAPEGHVVTLAEPTRTLDQNAAQWPYLEAFAEQLEWPINGQMTKITADDWKDILTCAFRNESPRVAMGLSGGMVLLGQRTSKFNKKDFSDWMEFLVSTAIDRDVVVYPDERIAA